MIYLLIILLVFGLVQSLLEIRKEDPAKSKWTVRKILSLIYIAGFVIGTVYSVIQEQEAQKVRGLIEGISSSVVKIDSVDRRLAGVLTFQDSLFTQYELVNAKLSKQIDLDAKNLEEKSPIIDLMDYDIKWLGNDSTSYTIEVCIRNFGKRNALVTGGHGYVVFFDTNNKPFFNVDIPGNNMNGILEPNEIERMTLCYNSYAIHGYQELKARTAFGLIYLEIYYQDILMKRNKVAHLYSGWAPKSNEFGGLRDWQINLGKKWATDNHK
jgi:hypothetical protein